VWGGGGGGGLASTTLKQLKKIKQNTIQAK